ncbi:MULTISPECIES: hypothetical protein [unclassified Chryseobacterium]|uniref:hypothetical protein n=1 Tax=unclassified Chryseobacterium TaxID=2593645 RepID=UPI00100A6795|nr:MULTISPECIES: hypothetical protein [unclassified Chryseobacterium]RXM52231.1 hypothetical protein BOQ64_10375 [Chryseobacterium sp. CH25]RXM64140.1 hypothetical protein BOQ60_14745 [Chryseobacterium sp. CH1]
MKNKVTALRLPKNTSGDNNMKVKALRLHKTAMPMADKLVEIRKAYEAFLFYETDGHYSTVYLVCLMLGMDRKLALALATATEAPDTTIHDDTKFELNDTWGHLFGPQQDIHSLTGGFHGIEEFFTAVKFLYTPNEDIKELGELLHRFGDTYAHTKINNLKPDDIKMDIDLKDADDATIKKYIEAWKVVGPEQNLKSKVEPWVKFFTYYMDKYGVEFLENESKQKEIFKGETLKEILRAIYLPKGTSDFVMYGRNGFTLQHATTDDGYPDKIYLRPQWYFIYVQNLAWIIATKFSLDYSKLNLSLFNNMLNFLQKHQDKKPSMKGIIDFEISRFLNKRVFYVPVFYASGDRILASVDASITNYKEVANGVVELSQKYMADNGVSPERIKVEEVYNVSYINTHEPIQKIELIAYKITF